MCVLLLRHRSTEKVKRRPQNEGWVVGSQGKVEASRQGNRHLRSGVGLQIFVGVMVLPSENFASEGQGGTVPFGSERKRSGSRPSGRGENRG